MSIIDEYTIKQATEDGTLFDIRTILKEEFRDKTLISHVTANLIGTHNYSNFDENELRETLNIPNVFDLLNQSVQILKKHIRPDKPLDHLYAGDIESPNGEQIRIWLRLNELGLFTVMLPEDN